MNDLLLNERTAQQIATFVTKPSHAVILVGPPGSGKKSLALQLSGELLGVPLDSVANHPYVRLVSRSDSVSIGIEAVRELEHFLSLKVPGIDKINRVIIIEDSHLLTTQAQNALLKTLEEPPPNTVLILTSNHDQALLPTISSRAQHIAVKRPPAGNLRQHFVRQGDDEQKVKQAFAISGGLPGLTDALLHDSEHPLLPATQKARELLSQTAYERLAQVEALSKQKELCQDLLFILRQMARVSLQTSTGPAADRWRAILTASYDATTQLAANAQPKLVLTNLFLNL